MPKFFLHVHDRADVHIDTNGCEFGDMQDARKEALRVIDELVSGGTWAANSHRGRFIIIADEAGRQVEMVALWERACMEPLIGGYGLSATSRVRRTDGASRS